jgi:ribonuclease D
MPASSLPLLIDTQPHIDRLCELIADSSAIGLDTEFVRTRTYAPQLGLIQIAAGDTAVCVDPLAELDDAKLWQLIFDSDRTNIMHSATQDLEVMWFHRGEILNSLIDTQVCAALLGYQPQIGYAGLVDDLAGVSLDKEHTRTDWTRRPLSTGQIDYAAKDVVYLNGMHDILRERLDNLGRYEWALEDCAALCNVNLYKPDIDNAWQRIKSIPFLPGEQQARAMELAAWRESRAVKLDKPRKWVTDDKVLLDIAQANPQNTDALASLESVSDGLARRQGSYLLERLQKADAAYAAAPDQYRQQIPDRDKDKAQSKALSKIVRAKAEELQIPAEVLGSKREISALIRGERSGKLASGWRYKVVGAELVAAL